MIRRTLRIPISLILTACLVYMSLGFKGCSSEDKKTFDAYAKDVAQALVDSQPLVHQLLVQKGKTALAAKYDRVVPAGQRLVAAIAASDKTQAIAIVAEIIPVIDEVAAIFTDNTNVLTYLAIATIALHFLVNHLPDEEIAALPSTSNSRSAGVSQNVVQKFKARKAWRCRNSSTGRYEKMEFCKANPAESTVETR